MSASRLHRRPIAGVVALVAIGILAAGCTKSGPGEQQLTTTIPTTTPAPSSSTPSPTEKSLSPTSLFTPSVPHPPAPPPATLPPGSFPGIYNSP
jgi:hypothetical protein